MKPNIVWYDIPALDLDRAIRFYSAVLGAPVKKETVGEVPLGWLPTEDGGHMELSYCEMLVTIGVRRLAAVG